MTMSKKLVAMVLAFFNIGADNKEPLALTDEQKQSLDAKVDKEGFAEKFMAKYNEDLDSTKELDAATEEIDAFMADNTPDEENQDLDNPDGIPTTDANKKQLSLTGKVKALGEQLKAANNDKKALEAKVATMSGLPEPDNPETIKGNVTKTMKHSKTHLFGSSNSWDAYDNRPWNEQAAGMSTTATDWNTANIDTLNKDIQDYFRKDPKKLMATMLDGLQIPKHWKVISGVSDEYIFTTIATGEITQGLKIQWLPKNNAKFDAQKGKVRDIQIDIEFKGNELKKLEKSYLNNFFNEGSTPYKQKFIMYVVTELMKRARKEDKIVLGKGVYAPNDSGNAGSFLNNLSGVIKLAVEQRGKSYRAFKLGKPTEENIRDYVKNFVNGLPYEIKNLPGLVFYTSPSWIRSYNEARRRELGRDQNYTGDTMIVDDFPNIEFYGYDQLEGYDFMFLTTNDNISILTDKPGEDGVLQFERDTRNTKVFGDYKLGAFIAMFGRKQIGLAANSFENQLFFSNDVEVLQDVYVPVGANVAIPSLKYHNSLIIGEHNTAATNITNFSDAVPGTKIYLLGNTEANVSTIKSNANISLIGGADLALSKDQLLVLFVKADGKFQEIERQKIGIQEVEEIATIVAPDTTIIDAATGIKFILSENTARTVITGFNNAVKGETYRIEGVGGANKTEIYSTQLLELSDSITFDKGVFIELYYNGDKFIEISRG